MKTNHINDRLKILVTGVHEKLRASNPTLTDIRHELSAKFSVDLSEYEIGDFVLQAGRRRGYSSTADKATTASKFAATAAFQATQSNDRQSHFVALEAHQDAARAHRAAANYHDGQVGFHQTAANSCQARRNVVLTVAELKARKMAEFENQKAHCAGCGTDFAIADAEQRSAENYVCPNCGENVNVTAGKVEQNDDAQQEANSAARAIAPDGFGWSLPDDVRQKVYARLEAGNEPDFKNQKCHCVACNSDFDLKPEDQTKENVNCPYCNERVNTAAGKKENDETEKQAVGASRAVMLDCARSASSILPKDSIPNYLLYMPEGVHVISPSQGGRPVTVAVDVNAQTAAALEKQRQLLCGSGNKPFFSIQHNTQVAAFWPTKFLWATRPDAKGDMVTGVWADGEWSQSGREAVEGKDFRSFSPTFFVNCISDDPANPARVVCNPDAKLNCGALENDPAFQSICPLWH